MHLRIRERLGRAWAQAGIVLGTIGLVCLFQASDLGWHALAAYQQHLGPHDSVGWVDRAKGGYTTYDDTFSDLIRAALANLAVALLALLLLAWRQGFRLRPSIKIIPQPHSKRRQ